jgi:hypothetical protein
LREVGDRSIQIDHDRFVQLVLELKLRLQAIVLGLETVNLFLGGSELEPHLVDESSRGFLGCVLSLLLSLDRVLVLLDHGLELAVLLQQGLVLLLSVLKVPPEIDLLVADWLLDLRHRLVWHLREAEALDAVLDVLKRGAPPLLALGYKVSDGARVLV